MSSHHFVKEDQEPALLILNPDAIPFAKVQELLEWSPLVIVSNTAIGKVLSWGIKIDVLILPEVQQDFDQIVLDQMPLQVIYYKDGQSELELTIQFLSERKQNNLNVMGKDLLTIFTSAASFSGTINIVLFDQECKWHFVNDGLYSKWLPGQSMIKMFFNNQIEQVVVKESGIFKLERLNSFWIGEEF